ASEFRRWRQRLTVPPIWKHRSGKLLRWRLRLQRPDGAWRPLMFALSFAPAVVEPAVEPAVLPPPSRLTLAPRQLAYRARKVDRRAALELHKSRPAPAAAEDYD